MGLAPRPFAALPPPEAPPVSRPGRAGPRESSGPLPHSNASFAGEVQREVRGNGCPASGETLGPGRQASGPPGGSEAPYARPEYPWSRHPAEKLGQAVDLVVMPAVGKLQDLGLKILQPRL